MGRPKGSKNRPKFGYKTGSGKIPKDASLSGIEKIVGEMVRQQVAAKIKSAVKALEKATKSLKKL